MAGISELGSKLISEFLFESPIKYCYSLGLHNNATSNGYYLASLPSNIPELVLETLSMKNILVQNLVMIAVLGFARGEIKILCYKDNTRTYLKAGFKV
ncbi:hypothetical protein AMTRI_Chr03g50320 [Amborella trichopoda]